MAQSSKVVNRPRDGATPESELSALVAAYLFVIFESHAGCHANEKGAHPGAPNAAKESENGCDAYQRIIPQ